MDRAEFGTLGKKDLTENAQSERMINPTDRDVAKKKNASMKPARSGSQG
jgi:hypothetical protein